MLFGEGIDLLVEFHDLLTHLLETNIALFKLLDARLCIVVQNKVDHDIIVRHLLLH